MFIHKTCIILLGPPCSGKSFLLSYLEKSLHFKCFDSGMIYRNTNNVHQENFIKRWNNFVIFIDNELINFISTNARLSNHIGVIYPKSIQGFEYLLDILSKFDYHNIITFLVKIDKRILIERSKIRQRYDDKNIIQRIHKYFENPLENYIKNTTKTDINLFEIENSFHFCDTYKMVESIIKKQKEKEIIAECLIYLEYKKNNKNIFVKDNTDYYIHNDINTEKNVLFTKIINKQPQYYLINENSHEVREVIVRNAKFNIKSIKNGILICIGNLFCKENIYIIFDLLYLINEKINGNDITIKEKLNLIQKYFFNENKLKKLNNYNKQDCVMNEKEKYLFCFVKDIE